jgi:hypothetical protein
VTCSSDTLQGQAHPIQRWDWLIKCSIGKGSSDIVQIQVHQIVYRNRLIKFRTRNRLIRYITGISSYDTVQGHAHQIEYRDRLIRYSTGTASSDTGQRSDFRLQYRDSLTRYRMGTDSSDIAQGQAH